jgi:hypothetical protein
MMRLTTATVAEAALMGQLLVPQMPRLVPLLVSLLLLPNVLLHFQSLRWRAL